MKLTCEPGQAFKPSSSINFKAQVEQVRGALQTTRAQLKKENTAPKEIYRKDPKREKKNKNITQVIVLHRPLKIIEKRKKKLV